eukprot:CAMPEP_0176499278 /NCGR_PEP_ID=MMETSP0200_2-20121128/12838_1 /TAXON_ID=947934 /ORGANISM="Chaetoceros sp., Strain GSL56" /LENGTH=476 /DNA_ID=CAMNT_0017897679 /DNA_START=81 /DNA_END=1511 /DNA_ORIENTATION=+
MSSIRNPGKPTTALTNTTKTKQSSWGARIYSLNTIDSANYGEVVSVNESGGGSSSTRSLASSSPFVIQNITDLPAQEHAMALLRRIQSEFTIIAQKRGYVLSSVTEMCCCADGLDHIPGKKKGRKTRTMPNNVLGYNLTQWAGGGGGGQRRRSVHRIHLRLRHPKTHTFYSYDDIAGVMCHELAHCEVGPHNAQFYKIMDEIMEQHAVFMVRGVVVDQGGFPVNSHDAHILGGERGNGQDRKRVEEIAQNRIQTKKMLGLGGSFRLGGGFLPVTGAAAASLAHLPPREAAKIAAERRIEERRRNDSKYCLPCQEVIEILDASSSDDEEESKETKDEVKTVNDSDIIILNDSDSSSVLESTPKISATILRTKRKKKLKDVAQQEQGYNDKFDESDVECTRWICATCTFHNDPEHLACEVCGYEQNRKHHRKKMLKIVREAQIQELKDKEVENSIREYGGFNIYGTAKKSSSTLDHIT